ncbi:MAG: hypothetical protein ACLP0J_08325 [Solirubrobacteraceae bacterium]
MPDTLKRIIRPRDATNHTPTATSTTKSSSTQLGYTRGPTQSYEPAGESLPAQLTAAGLAACVPAGVDPAR